MPDRKIEGEGGNYKKKNSHTEVRWVNVPDGKIKGEGGNCKKAFHILELDGSVCLVGR